MRFEHLETDGAVLAATRLAIEEFQYGGDSLVASTKMQFWLVAAYGDEIIGGPLDEGLALGIIEKMGAVFEAEASDTGELAVEQLGEVLVGAARLAANHELGIAPILDLARVFTQRADVIALQAPARLARAVTLAPATDTPQLQRARIAGALAMCIAKGLEDCELLHEVRVKLPELLVNYGHEKLDSLAAERAAAAEPRT